MKYVMLSKVLNRHVSSKFPNLDINFIWNERHKKGTVKIQKIEYARICAIHEYINNLLVINVGMRAIDKFSTIDDNDSYSFDYYFKDSFSKFEILNYFATNPAQILQWWIEDSLTVNPTTWHASRILHATTHPVRDKYIIRISELDTENLKRVYTFLEKILKPLGIEPKTHDEHIYIDIDKNISSDAIFGLLLINSNGKGFS